MQALRRFALLAATASPLLLLGLGSTADDRATSRFQHSGRMPVEETAAVTQADFFSEAPTGFDNRTNGFMPQGPAFDTLDEDNVVPLRSFNDNRFIFEEVETLADGLGPTYNAQSCRECHQNVVTGGASQIAEHRTGRLDASGGSSNRSAARWSNRARLIPTIVERVAFEDDIRTFRISTNTLGNGFVEAIANETLLAIRDAQPAEMRGTALMVPVLEADSADARRPLRLEEPARQPRIVLGRRLPERDGHHQPAVPGREHFERSRRGLRHAFDPVPDPEDDGVDVVAFANFMRATKAPSRGPITRDVHAGEQLFTQIGCAGCHVATTATAPAGHAHQRRRVRGAAGAGQQDHPSLQRLPAARHRHGRRHPVSARRRSSRRPRTRSAPRRCGRCGRATG